MSKSVLLLGIILLALSLRFFQLDSNPPSLTWDEAAWGYNAYALGLDGRDEFGRFLPYDYLKSFGDFKPPMYAYITIIPIMVFGLSEFAVRFPSALFGTLAVFITYFLVKQIFRNSDQREYYALLTSLLLAISPWHILLSRAAFEANIASFFIIIGAYFFIKGVQEKGWFLVLSAIFFTLSIYTFNSARVVAPLLVFILALGSYKALLKRKKQTILAGIIGIVVVLPIFGFLLSSEASLRFKEVNIFSDSSIVTTSNKYIANDEHAWWSKIIHNRRISYAQAYIKHYLDNLSPDFLFIKGDGNPKFSTQDVGQLYLWELPFFIAGILFLIKKKEGRWWMIPLWIIVALVPAGLARETPHALRIANALPMFQILTAYGIIQLFTALKKINQGRLYIWKAAVLGTILVAFAFLIYFLHGYFIHYPREFSGEWQYGYKESISYVASQKDKYKKIYITDALGRAYIYYLFYLKTLPSQFRNTADYQIDGFGLIDVRGYNNMIFSRSVESEPQEPNTLYIIRSDKVPVGADILKTFYLLDGSPRLTAYVYK